MDALINSFSAGKIEIPVSESWPRRERAAFRFLMEEARGEVGLRLTLGLGWDPKTLCQRKPLFFPQASATCAGALYLTFAFPYIYFNLLLYTIVGSSSLAKHCSLRWTEDRAWSEVEKAEGSIRDQ